MNKKKEYNKMDLAETLVYILLQELFENDLFDIEELKIKYTLTEKQEKLLIKIFDKLYN